VTGFIPTLNNWKDDNVMKWIAVLAALSVFAAGSSIAAEEKKESSATSSSTSAAKKATAGEATIHTASSLQWGDAPPGLPAGGKLAVLDGNPGKPGAFTVRLQMPDGYKIMPHTHPAAERVTVISGTLHVGMGEKLDENSGTRLSAGDFVVLPKGSKHSAWSTGDTVIQIQGEGPFDIKYADATDDPRKQKK